MTSLDRSAPARTGLQLFTYPLLIDDGRLSERADELEAALGSAPFAEIHPEDAEAAGVADGASVIVRTDVGEATLPARVSGHVARGAVFVPFNQPGFAANTLLSGRMTAPVELAAVDVPEAEDAGSPSAGSEPVGSASGGAA